MSVQCPHSASSPLLERHFRSRCKLHFLPSRQVSDSILSPMVLHSSLLPLRVIVSIPPLLRSRGSILLRPSRNCKPTGDHPHCIPDRSVTESSPELRVRSRTRPRRTRNGKSWRSRCSVARRLRTLPKPFVHLQRTTRLSQTSPSQSRTTTGELPSITPSRRSRFNLHLRSRRRLRPRRPPPRPW